MKSFKSFSVLFAGLFFNQSEAKIFNPSVELYSQIGGPKDKEDSLFSTAQAGILFRLAFGGDNFNFGPDFSLGYGGNGIASSLGLSAQSCFSQHYLVKLRIYSAGTMFVDGKGSINNLSDSKFEANSSGVFGVGLSGGYLFTEHLYVMIGANLNLFSASSKASLSGSNAEAEIETSKKSFSISISLGYLK